MPHYYSPLLPIIRYLTSLFNLLYYLYDILSQSTFPPHKVLDPLMGRLVGPTTTQSPNV